jgi:hypothetical protein
VPDGHRHVVDELGARREMPVHGIAEHRGLALGLQQQRRRAAVVQLQVQQQAAQRRTDIGRMAHEFAQRPQAVEAEPLADQQREMRAVRQTGAFEEQPPGHLERQARIRIPEQRHPHARADQTRSVAVRARPAAPAGWRGSDRCGCRRRHFARRQPHPAAAGARRASGCFRREARLGSWSWPELHGASIAAMLESPLPP